MEEFDIRGPGERVLHAYDSGATGRGDELAVFWHGGTPNIGLPPEPLLARAAELGIRLLGADRPGYGGTTPDPAATVADVAADVTAVADALGIRTFGTIGHSGGGPRALATAALLPDRVRAAVAISSPAPEGAPGLDRYAGMADGPAAEQRASAEGRAALTALLERDEFDESAFTADDYAALEGPWAWFLPVVRAATTHGVGAQVDDDLAMAAPWGAEVADIRVPVLLLHGTADRMVPAGHSAWIAAHAPTAEYRAVEGAGHISVLTAAGDALTWLRRAADALR